MRKKKTVKKISSLKKKAVEAIHNSKYGDAFIYLLRQPAAKKAFLMQIKLEVRHEAVAYFHGDRELSKQVTQDSLHKFSWPVIIKELREHLPFLHASLAGAVSSKSNEDTKLRM